MEDCIVIGIYGLGMEVEGLLQLVDGGQCVVVVQVWNDGGVVVWLVVFVYDIFFMVWGRVYW